MGKRKNTHAPSGRRRGERPRAARADLLGAHVSAAGGIDKAPLNARKVGASAIQVFTRNQRRWDAPPLTPEAVERFRRGLEENGVAVALAHASYLLNLAARGDTLRRSVATLLDEWDRAETLGLLGVCFHPGAHTGMGRARGLARTAAALNRIRAKRPEHRSLLLIENTAGQGTSLCAELEELAELLELLEDGAAFAVCLDTCHLFAAGYDLRDATAYRKTFRAVASTIGLERVRAFHLNDSRTPLGSRVDRHASIGEGHLGKEAFRLLVRDRRFRGLPKVLETPGGDAGYQRELRLLRRLAARKS